jgi:hypothetical protein
MHKVSEAGKEAMFINPAPHMGNIANRVQQREGEMTLARAMALMAHPDPKITELLEKYGGTEHFLKEPQTAISKIPGYGQVLKASNKGLDNFEMAMRGAVFEKYLKQAEAVAAKEGRPVSRDELYHAGAQARAIADYANTSGLTRWLADKLGAPFPQWHINVMGQALGDAMANPGRSARFFDAGHNINKDLAEPYLGYDLSSGKPTEEALNFLSNPLGVATSPSTINPVFSAAGQVAKAAVLHPKSPVGKAVGEPAEGLLNWFVPPGVTTAFGANPFGSPGTPAMRSILGLGGVRTTKAPPAPPPSSIPVGGIDWSNL